MFSVMKIGTCLRPSWTAIVCPIISGTTVEARDQHLMTRFSPEAFICSIFLRSLGWTYGPFFSDLAIATP